MQLSLSTSGAEQSCRRQEAAAQLTQCTVLQEVTGREDSESYAKRTITEIETCLGFTFHGADDAEEAPAEAISTNELEVSILPGITCMHNMLTLCPGA